MANFGEAKQSDSDDDILEGVRFWTGRAEEFTRDGEADAAKQARDMAEGFESEARRRGIL